MINKKIELEEAILLIIKSIATKPERISIYTRETYDQEKGEVLQVNIKVATEDIPVCIGRGGTTAEAIRKLSCLIAKKLELDKRLYVRIDAPQLPGNHFYKQGQI